jgi:hypothetical protein
VSVLFGSIGADDHDVAPSTLVNAACPLTATHSAGDAHETAFRGTPDSNATPQLGGAAVGLRVLSTLPLPSTATHSDSDGHEIALSAAPPSIVVPDQLSCGAATAGGAASAASAQHAASITAAVRGAAARVIRCFEIDARRIVRRLAWRSLVISSRVFEALALFGVTTHAGTTRCGRARE